MSSSYSCIRSTTVSPSRNLQRSTRSRLHCGRHWPRCWAFTSENSDVVLFHLAHRLAQSRVRSFCLTRPPAAQATWRLLPQISRTCSAGQERSWNAGAIATGHAKPAFSHSKRNINGTISIGLRASACWTPSSWMLSACNPKLQVFGPDTRMEYESLAVAIRRDTQQVGAQRLDLFLAGDPAEWDTEEWLLREDLLRWSSENRDIRIFADAASLDDLEPAAANSLASLIEATRIDLFAVEGLETSIEPRGLIAEVGSPNAVARWATTDVEARVPGDSWGTGVAGSRTVRVHAGEQQARVSGKPVAPTSLRRQFAGTLVEVAITNEFDGAIDMFGERFWTALRAQIPELDTRLSSASPLARVRYVDRYLKSPLSVRLLREVLMGFRAQSNLWVEETELEVETALLTQGGQNGPWELGHNWEYEEDRRRITDRVLSIKGAAPDMKVRKGRDLAHARELKLEWRDGASWILRLDQGLGFWTTSGAERFPFDRNTDEQSRDATHDQAPGCGPQY